MKVERDKQFQPITVVIENEQEAHELWHRLNVPGATIENASHGYRQTGAVYAMRSAFNDVYHPEKEKA